MFVFPLALKQRSILSKRWSVDLYVEKETIAVCKWDDGDFLNYDGKLNM